MLNEKKNSKIKKIQLFFKNYIFLSYKTILMFCLVERVNLSGFEKNMCEKLSCLDEGIDGEKSKQNL